MADIAFIVGLILFFRGQFRLGRRYVTKPMGRRFGLILMLPMLITFCGAFYITSSVPVNENMTIEQYMNTILSNPDFDRLINVQLIAFILSVGYVVWLFFQIPQTDAPPAPPSSPSAAYPFGGTPTAAPPPPTAPAIMTTAEAAAYLRVPESEIMRLIDDGKLAAARTASGFRIAKSVIDDYVKNIS